MAIGLGRVFGFHFLENFDHPYVSLSVTEFWRRWHISLSSWFRDYVYIPLGGNRVSKPRWVLNILAVWGLTGLWHGAQWNFLAWGLYYAALLLLEKLVWGKLLARLPKIFRWLYTALAVLVGWVLFEADGLGAAWTVLGRMFLPAPTDWMGVMAADATIFQGLIFLPVGVVCMLPWRDWLGRPKEGEREESVPALVGKN